MLVHPAVCLQKLAKVCMRLKLTDEELAARPMTPVTRERNVSKSLRAYASMVSSADKGAVRLID